MINIITVRDVLETNNCAGKKQFHVTAMEEDETVRSEFRLTTMWLQPHEKLKLTTVLPMDRVDIVLDQYRFNSMLMGEYVASRTDVSNRSPICRCATPLVSDGFDVYCPNPDCFLTITARIERLGSTAFFKPDMFEYDEDVKHSGLGFGLTNNNFYNPFFPLTQGMFWGKPGWGLEEVLQRGKFEIPSLSTFLVEPLFIEYFDSNQLPDVLDKSAYSNINRFYGHMDELLQRRDYESEYQNVFMAEFIHCLGIESLSRQHIRSLVNYEMCLGHVSSPLLPYAYALTHIDELVKNIDLHPLEASTIVAEVRRRKHEFFDIFYHYTGQSPDIKTIFKYVL